MKLLIVGISVRSMVQSAAAEGYDVTSLDFFGDTDLPDGVRVLALGRDFGLEATAENLAVAVRQVAGEADAVVLGSGVENCSELYAACAGLRIFGNTQTAVESARDMATLERALAGSDIRLPEFRGADGELPTNGRWLVKDLGHSGGVGVRSWDGSARPGSREVLQEYVEGRLCSATFLADGQRAVLLGSTRQYAGVPQLNAREFAWCGNAAPLLDAELEEKVVGAVNRLTHTCGLSGINGIDFIEREGTPYLIEVNPRYPSSTELLERLHGVNALALHMQACEGRLPILEPLTAASGAVGKGILYARETVRIHGSQGWTGFELADIPHESEVIRAGEPVCSVFASGEDAGECWERVLQNAAELERIIYQ